MNKTKLSLEKGDNGLMYVVRGSQRRIASITEIELCDDLRTLRAAVLAAPEAEVKATFGVGIRKIDKMIYDEATAIQWASENGFDGLLKLDTRSFETAAKGIKPAFVGTYTERQATIARDLSGALRGAEHGR
jgi:hypothetical protein